MELSKILKTAICEAFNAVALGFPKRFMQCSNYDFASFEFNAELANLLSSKDKYDRGVSMMLGLNGLKAGSREFRNYLDTEIARIKKHKDVIDATPDSIRAQNPQRDQRVRVNVAVFEKLSEKIEEMIAVADAETEALNAQWSEPAYSGP